MKTLVLSFLLFVFCLVQCGTAQQSGPAFLALAQKELPKCALTCMVSAISKSKCEISDVSCLKNDQTLNNQITTCVSKTCTLKEALTTKNFTQTLFGAPHRDHSHLVSIIGIVGGIVAIFSVVLRILARLPCLGGTWGPDDWAILVSMLTVIPLTFLSIPLASHGLGKDIWTVPFDSITAILHIYYFDEIFYLSSIALFKISILLFYLRIFPNKTLRGICWAMIAISVGYIVGFVTATIVQCSPIRNAWERWDGEHAGQCYNFNIVGWTSASINIIMDVVVICLPLGEISKLALTKRKKAGVMLMFLGGSFVTVVSILRLQTLVHLAKSENLTWDYTPIGYWSTLEVHVGVIVACLPAVRSLQARMFAPPHTENSGYLYYNDSQLSKGLGKSADKSVNHDTLLDATTYEHSPPPSIGRSRARTNTASRLIRPDDIQMAEFDFNHVNGSGEERGEDDISLLPPPQDQRLPQYPAQAYDARAPTNAIYVSQGYNVDVEANPRRSRVGLSFH